MAIKRIVLFKFKKDTPQKTIDQIFSGFEGLKDLVPGIQDFFHGPYSSSDNLNQGYTHAFVVTFRDAAVRDHFGSHTEHQRIVGILSPHAEGVLAFDFFA